MLSCYLCSDTDMVNSASAILQSLNIGNLAISTMLLLLCVPKWECLQDISISELLELAIAICNRS